MPSHPRFALGLAPLLAALAGLAAPAARAGEPLEPPARQNATLFTRGDSVLLLGGVDPDAPGRGVHFSDMWQFTNAFWEEVPDTFGDDGPPASTDLPVAVTPEGNTLVFPGFDSGGMPDGDTLFLSGSTFFGLGVPHPDGAGGASVSVLDGLAVLASGAFAPDTSPTGIARLFDFGSGAEEFLPDQILLAAVLRATNLAVESLGEILLLFGQDALGDPTGIVQLIQGIVGGGRGTTVVDATLGAGPGMPAARTAQAWAQRGDRAVVFGGVDDDGTVLGDLWLLDPELLAVEAASGVLSAAGFRQVADLEPRRHASIAFLDDQRVLIFGGEAPDGTTLAGTLVVELEPPLFADGFESGNTTAWASE